MSLVFVMITMQFKTMIMTIYQDDVTLLGLAGHVFFQIKGSTSLTKQATQAPLKKYRSHPAGCECLEKSHGFIRLAVAFASRFSVFWCHLCWFLIVSTLHRTVGLYTSHAKMLPLQISFAFPLPIILC